MAEQTKPRTRKPRSTAKPAAAAAAPSPTKTSPPTAIIEEQTLKAILAWMNVVDDWTVAGYQNKLPRWVYVLVAFLILT
jgi:hypothetical protein